MNSAAPLELRYAEPALLECVRQRARRQVLWMRHLWAQGASSPDQGLAIGHGEVDRLLRNPVDLAAERERFFSSDAEARAMLKGIAAADAALERDRAWSDLCACFSLGAADADLLALAVAIELDTGLGRVFGYLHDDAQACYATQWLAAQLFDWPAGTSCGRDSNLVAWRMATPSAEARNPWSERTAWHADPAVPLSLQQKIWREPRLDSALTLMRADPKSKSLHPAALASIVGFAKRARGPIEIEIIGPSGAGKRTLAAQFAAEIGRTIAVADCATLLADKTGEAAADSILRVLRFARAFGAIAYFRAADCIAAASWRAAARLYDVAIFDRQAMAADAPPEGAARQTVHLAPLSSRQRLELWSVLSDAPAPHPVREWPLVAGEIAAAAEMLPHGNEAVRRACRPRQSPPPDLLQTLICPYDWDDLVLPAETRRQLAAFEQQARLRWPVYEDWAFERLVPMGKGITALFAGQSGTGKTMSAQVIARALELELCRVDLAGVVNKYIGETEKRLKQVFDYCERSNVMLLFDEADALFGQRTQVRDAHDRFANIEIDYLLQRMEQFGGISVLATNRKNDLDKAFLRRLRFVVDFVPPGVEERLALWRLALHRHAPTGEELLDEIDWNLLAERLTMTGADIKAAALGAAFLAYGEGTRIAMRHVLAAARREMTKHGVVLRAGFAEGGR